MCMGNALPVDPAQASRGPWQADAIPKPDPMKGVQKVEDYHKAKKMARERLGILGGTLGVGDRFGRPNIQQFGSSGGGGGGGAPQGSGK